MASDTRPPDSDPDEIEMTSELARARQSIPPPERQGQALARLMDDVEARQMNRKTNGGSIIGGLLGGSRVRGVLAAVAAAGIVGGAGLGIAAASGNEPVRNLLRISSDSAIKVEFTGVVVEATASELRVDVAGDLRVVALDANTNITRSGDPAGIDALPPGTLVEVHGRLLPDNSIVATRVNIEDDDVAGSPTAGVTTPASEPTARTTTVPSTPNAQPSDDHGEDDDDQGDDNSGPGSGDDQGEDDDSGPASGDDDGEDDDSGTGSGDDLEDEDNSGSGSGDDSADDDDGEDRPDGLDSDEEPDDDGADNATGSSDDGDGEHLSDSGGEVDATDD